MEVENMDVDGNLLPNMDHDCNSNANMDHDCKTDDDDGSDDEWYDDYIYGWDDDDDGRQRIKILSNNHCDSNSTHEPDVSYPAEPKDKDTFQQSYRCYPFSCIGRMDLEGGNRIIMPQSALDRLASLQIEYPMMFEIKSHFYEEPISHCGVLEFTAEEGFVFVPSWMMNNLQLQLEPGELVKLRSVQLPKGTYMKLKPHKTEFIRLPNPKEVLESALKSFACVTAGETMMISYNEKEYFFDVLETEPNKNAISVVETDCVVDFVEPLDYELEQEQRRKAIAPLGKEVKEIESEEEVKFKAFSGAGRRLDGKEQSKSSCDDVEAARKSCGKLDEERESDGRGKGTSFQAFQGKKNLLTG